MSSWLAVVTASASLRSPLCLACSPVPLRDLDDQRLHDLAQIDARILSIVVVRRHHSRRPAA